MNKKLLEKLKKILYNIYVIKIKKNKNWQYPESFEALGDATK